MTEPLRRLRSLGASALARRRWQRGVRPWNSPTHLYPGLAPAWYDVAVPQVKEVLVRGALFRIRDDVIFARPAGELARDQAELIVSLANEVFAAHGHTLVLIDLKHAGPMPVESRRLLAKLGAEQPPLAMALFNQSALHRGVTALLLGAMNLFGKRRQNVRQFSTEEAAASWLEGERQRLLPTA